MDLIGMMNGLERMDNVQPFSAAAYKLAGKIIALCNSLYWQCDISIDLKRLSIMAACSSSHTAIKVRDELVNRGVIAILQKGSKGKPSCYRLNDISKFYANFAQNQDKYSAGCGANNARNTREYGAKSAAINRQDNTPVDPYTAALEEMRKRGVI